MKLFKQLCKYKIPTAKYKVVKTEKEAVKAANQIGFPVVLKAVSPEVMHKTDYGAVKMNLYDKFDIKNAYDSIKRNLKGKKLKGMLVQKQIKRGIELIVGGKKDEQFGQLIIFGLGGIYVDVFKDISVRVCPITGKDAKEMIREIKGHPILAGARGKKPVNEGALVSLLLKVSKMLEKEQPKEMDLNPVIANEKGYIVVDARIIR